MKLFRGTEPTEAQVKGFQSNLKTLDQLIGHNKYAAGSALTIADLSLVATLSVLFATENKELKEVPNVVKYYEGLKKELPYYNEVNGGLAEAFKQFAAAAQNK
jgi:glutathione S-transferase